MISKLENIIHNKQKVLGIDLYFQSSDLISYSLIQTIENNGNLLVHYKQTGKTYINDLESGFPESCPTIISIRGKIVITKKTQAQDISLGKKNLSSIIPGYNSEDYYLQHNDSTEENCYYSLIRKVHLDGIVNQLKEKNINVVGIYLGPFALENISKDLSDPGNGVVIPYSKISFKDSIIINFSTTDKHSVHQINYKGIKLNSEEIIPFASVFGYYKNSYSFIDDIEAIKKNQQEHSFQHKLKTLGIISLVIFLSILTLNYIVFTNQNNKYNKLSNKYAAFKSDFDRLEYLQSELKLKQKLIDGNNLLAMYNISKYFDKIAYTLPNEIVLRELCFQPLIKKPKNEKEVAVLHNRIFISGFTPNSMKLNSWIEVMQKEPWISEVDIIRFIQSDKKHYRFELNIKLK